MGSQNDGNTWMSVTPCKPVPTRSKLNPADSNRIETSNWEELLGIYGGLLQEETPSNGVAAVAEKVSPAAVGEQNGYMTNNGSSICNSYNQTDGNWSMNQHNKINLHQKDVYNNTSQEAKDGFSIPYWPFNTLHSPMGAESGQASAYSSFQLAPVTPDHSKLMQNNQRHDIQYPPTDQISVRKSEQQKTLAVSVQQEIAESFCNDFGQPIPKWSDEGITASVVENQPCLDGNAAGIDLNRTPKLNTPAKRRKHRPKVVREGKKKRTPNATTPLSTPTPIVNSESQPNKRKYVRRKNIQASTTKTKSTAEANTLQEIQPASKSCRRMNFGLEEVTDSNRDQINDSKTKEQKESEGFINLNSKHQDLQCRTVNNIDLASAMFKEKQQGYSTLQQHTSTVMNPTNKMLIGMSSLLTSTAAAHTSNNYTLNVIDKTMQNTSHYQPRSQNGYNILGDSSGQIFQTNYAGTGRARPLLQSTNMFNGNGDYNQRGLKRAYYQTADVLGHLEQNLLSSSQWTKYYVGSSKINSQYPATAEKSKVSDVCDGNETRFSAFPSLRTKGTGVMHGIYTNCLPSQFMERISDSYPGKVSNLKKPKIAAHQISGNHYVNQMAVGSNFLKQNAFPQVHCSKHMDDKMFQWQTGSSSQNALVPVGNWDVPFPLTEVPRLNALANVANWDQTSPDPDRNTQSTTGHEIEISRKPKNSKKVTKKERMLPDHQNLYTKLSVAGSSEKVYLGLLHEILEKLQSLQIDGSSPEKRGDSQNALVPYIGHGSVVPYKDPIKKKKLRAKVNLDAETNRLWNLLMWNEGSDSTETMDKHTEKWWEEERNVFRGRIDSFIARMHMVQGDRRFSPWKGSVVDSVIGVFLTQNVSDHLSSSAFMSLVAKFPLLPVKEQCQNASDVIVEEPDLQTEPGGAISYHDRISSKPVFYQSSTTCSGTSEQQTEDIMTGSSPGKKPKTTEEEVISSQSSSNSFVYQAVEEVKFKSDANSGVEDQTIVGNFQPDQYSEEPCLLNVIDGSLTLEGPEFRHQQAEYVKDDWNNSGNQRGRGSHDYPSNFRKLHFQGCDPSSSLPYLQEQEANLSEFSVEGGIYSLPLVEEEERHYSRPIGQMSKRVNAAPGQVTRKKEILGPNVTHQAPPFYQSDSMSISGQNINSRSSKQSIMVHDGNTSLNTSELASTFSSIQPELTKRIPDGQSGQNGNNDSAKASTGISNGRKRAIDREIKKTFDWDSLRRQTQSLASTKERSKNTKDSLDYEKLRNADVEEISDTIKDRGMNNMLAERMKDFLNRLVQEHESVDLEWLRDVPPEKVKDYLLSIRGLGLKSVECVRLLTLHNVAFPVDTNVGRIAVRLGWVPLQPLPESLQLHLLELYPVLETVQKYLWPRLCKLDQKTLYELHYQMITFGKVFCTKSRPNCNACPMRAECRHFASAFASARLALPGPEEKSIVSCPPVAVNDIPSRVIKPMLLSPAPVAVNDIPSTIIKPKLLPPAPVAVNDIPATVIKPMLLPPAVDNPTEYRGYRNNEPTVEEPKTPDHSGAESESDIEDAFYGDTDEIPHIKLNLEEFMTNLQTFMQGRRDVEGDISKALVAINPLGTNTARQLKGVNRLRTEHYVYELPDYHPLLRGMDRREADDPSPYLLAIWTPGETADSIRPPESKCDNQASGSLCQDETCFSCNSIIEANSQVVRGTLLIPCRTAMRGSFPLNGTYFQVNEMFADHASSINPIYVPREQIWNLPRRTVYCGTSVSSIFRGLTTEEIQLCFWRGFVCVRGFEQKTRSPKPLSVRLHVSLSKQAKTAIEENRNMSRTQKEQQARRTN